MKKITTLLFVLFLSIVTFSQSYNGIKLGRNLSQTKSELVSKGFIFQKYLTSNSQVFQKIIDGRKVVLTIVYSPNTKIVWKFLVEVDEATSWTTAKDKYLNYVSILNQKYGQHINIVADWEKPYYEGDGYEIQALYFDKATIMTEYQDEEGNGIVLDLDAYKINRATILIHYENQKAHEIYINEQNKINQQMY